MNEISYFTETEDLQITFSPELIGAVRRKNLSHQNCRTGGRQTVFPLKKDEDIISMANWMNDHNEKKYVLAFVLGINLGLRANELLDLKIKDVFFPDGTVRKIEDPEDISDGITILQSKTSKYRTVFLNDACKEALEWCFPDWGVGLCGENYLFPSREGGHIGVGMFRKVLKDAAKACGVKYNIGTHTCRKTWGWHQYHTAAVESTADIAMLQRAFGHSSQDITLRYLGITDEEDKAMYNRMNLKVISDKRFIR